MKIAGELKIKPEALSRRPGGPGSQVRGGQLPPGLSQEQVRLLAFLRDFTARNPYPPTVRELARGCGISSTSVADRQLRRLEEGEYLTRRPRHRPGPSPDRAGPDRGAAAGGLPGWGGILRVACVLITHLRAKVELRPAAPPGGRAGPDR